MASTLDWNDLRYLLALADKGTLTSAAKLLGVSQPTAGRRLAALEAAVGARLFLRTAEGHQLTPEGAKLCDVAAELARRMAAIQPTASSVSILEGLVRVAVTEVVGKCLLELALPALLREHPALEVELHVGNVPSDLTRGDVDLAIRLVAPEGGHIVARKLGTQRYAVYGSPRYLRENGTPHTEDELSAHRFVWPSRELLRGPEATWLEGLAKRPRISLRLNSLGLMIEAAADGLGLAVLPEPIGRNSPRLQNVFTLPAERVRTVFLVQHEDARTIPRVRAVADAIASAMGSVLDPPSTKDP